jgi:hypothetical protein
MAKKKTENMNKDKVREMIKDSLKNPKKADQVEEGNAFIVAADAARDAGKKEFEFPKGSGKMHPVKIKSDIDESSSSEERRIAKRAIRSIAKYRGVGEDEARNDLIRAAKELGNLNETQITENKREAFDELQMIMDQLYELSDQAKMIFRNNFPGEYDRLDAYGALDFGTSSNRFDVTLEGTLENLDMEEEDEDMMQEDLDLGHQDNEPHMLKSDLYRIGKYAMELYQMMDDFEGKGEVDLPHWWQSKISNAKSAIVGAKHYLDFEIKEPQIDAMVDVASEEEVIDEGTWSVGTSKEIKNIMGLLDVAMDIKDPQELIDFLDMHSKSMYNIVGDDLFHDDIDGAKREAKEGNMDRAQNRLSDAYERARFFLERQMDREGLKEEEAGEVDMIASDIQKAMNKHKKDDAKMHQLKKARTAMNKGDLDKAKKIVGRYLEEGLPKGYWDKKMDAKDEVDESYKTLVNKIKKQGKSEKAAKAIAGAVASYKAKGGGKGPTAKQRK